MESITNDEVLLKNQKRNRILIIFYKMFSYDLLFFYTISFLFYANIKNLSASQIVFGEAFYPLFKIIFQIPCTFLVQKLGKKNGLIIANISILLYLIIVMSMRSTLGLIFANVFCAFGFVIKGMAESTFLYDSIEDGENRHERFSKYEGGAIASYYFLDAVTAVATGFLFVINAYLPMILSFVFTLIATIIAFKMKEIKPIQIEKGNSFKTDLTNYFNDIKISSKFIFRSNRLKSLIIYDAILIALLRVIVNLRTSLLSDLNVPSEKIGIIFSIMGLVACISAARALYLHNSLKNRSLSMIGLIFTVSIFISGLIALINLPKFLVYYIILIMYAIQYFSKGAFQTLIKQYLNSFCESKMRLKIYSTSALIESIFTTLISIACSFVLVYFSTAVTLVFLGIITTISMIILLKYMKTRVGLKPENYPEKDIDYSDLI